MKLEVGETYLSSKHSQYITVLAIDKEDAQNYTLAIMYVDKVTLSATPADLVVSKKDTETWTQVVL